MIDPLKDLPGYAFRRASATWIGILAERIAALGMGVIDASILIVIGANPQIKQADLCTVLSIKPANMTPRIARLIDAGLIRREPIDGRSSALGLTEEGTLRRDQAWAIMLDHEDRFRNRIGAVADEFIATLQDLWRDPAAG